MRLRHIRTAAPLAAAVALAFSGTAIADTGTGANPGTNPGPATTTGQNGTGMFTNNGRHCGWWRGRGHHGHHGRNRYGRGCPPQAGGPGTATGGTIGTPAPAPRPGVTPGTCPTGTSTSSRAGDRDDCTTGSGGTTQAAGCPTGTSSTSASSDDRDRDDCGTTASGYGGSTAQGGGCDNGGHGGFGGRD